MYFAPHPSVRVCNLPHVRVVAMRMKAIRGLAPAGPPPSGLFPEVAAPAPPRSLVVLDERARGTRFIQQAVQSVINSPESTGMGFWSLNPYVGCEFGCSYCYARFAHRYVVERAHDAGAIDESGLADLRGPNGWEAFERRIFVKKKEAVLAALERDLGRVRAGHAPLVIGTATDPYQPAERQFGITRGVLERLVAERGLSVELISKGPLVTRDIDLWLRIQQHNRVTIHVSLISADAALLKRFEARSPMPHARLRALARLTAAGLHAGLIVAPILPGVTDSSVMLRELLVAARKAGAHFAHPAPLRLYPPVRGVFLPVLQGLSPELETRYRAAFGQGRDAPRRYHERLRLRFARIARQAGVPADRDEGGHILGEKDPIPMQQLDLWRSAGV